MRIRIRTHCLSKLLWLTSLCFLLATMGLPLLAETPVARAGTLAQLRELYSQLGAVHFRASVEVSIRNPLYEGHATPLHGFGHFEYWEDNGKFRSQAWIDPRLGLMDNLEFAYDGSRYQMFDFDQGVLAVEEPQFLMGDFQKVPTAVPNPFYLPIKFLGPGDDACPGCLPTLGHAQRESAWNIAERELRPTMTVGVESQDAAEGYRLPGGERMGQPYDFQIVTGPVSQKTSASQRFPLERVQRVNAQGQLIESIHFSKPIAIDGSATGHTFPSKITMFAIDPSLPADDHVVVVIDYTIEVMETRDGFEDATFVLPADEASAIWVRGELVTKQ